MSSDERHAFLGEIVGKENAQGVNALFESKLLLKNQQQGMITWAKKVAGLSPTIKRDLIAKIEKLERVLSPAEGEQFLKDLASTKLGIGVTEAEAKTIMELSKKVTDLKEAGGKPYGNAYLDLQDYVDSITPQKKDSIFTNVGGLQKSLSATLDLSAPLRQGRALFGTKEWLNATKRMFGYATREKSLRNLNADIVSHADFKLMQDSGLALTSLAGNVSSREEQYVSKFVNKLPLIRNSERAYTGFLTDLRFNKFNSLLEQAEKAGLDPRRDKELLKAISNFVNSATGRGDLGAFEPASKALANAFFSPKFIKSRLDMINPVYYVKQPPFVRKEALKTLFSLVGTSATMLGLAAAAGADVELDPRSSDFGKFKIGNTRVDVTGGYSALIRLGAQIATKSTKSSSTGKITELNTDKYGSRTSGDVLVDFFKNKESPIVSTINTLYGGKDFSGNSVKTAGERAAFITGQFIPILVKDMAALYADGGIEKVVGYGIPSFFGANIQTYGSSSDKAFSPKQGTLEKVLGIDPKPKAEFVPLLEKMKKNQVTVSLPTSSTQIKVPGKETRDFTDTELRQYQDIYQKNIQDNLKKFNVALTRLDGDAFTKMFDKIKRDTTDQSKAEFIRSVLTGGR
jgi:hypothetical protein